MYSNMNIFLVDILGMTNHCNLHCDYCDWAKYKYSKLTESEKEKVHKHLLEARTFIEMHYPNFQMIEYSGGEPFTHPEIVMDALDVFPDKLFRVISNALLIKPEHIEKLAKHGKAYLGISLDGITEKANYDRGLNKHQLEKILTTLDWAMEAGVPVMLLCTLSKDNIDEFFDYIDYIYTKYKKFVDNGMLAMPAHMLASYSVVHRHATDEQIAKFKKGLSTTTNPLVTKIPEHYELLFDYTRTLQCSINQWSASMHFIGDAIATTGEFTSWRCGMRGVGKIGTFNVSEEIIHDTYSHAMEEALKTDFASYKCGCIIDWGPFDLIIGGTIPIAKAEKWFKLFSDNSVKAWITKHSNDFSIVYTRFGNKTQAMCERITHNT